MMSDINIKRVFLRITGLGVFVVIKPLWICVFIFIAVILGLSMNILNYTVGLKSISGAMILFLYGLHFLISGIAPIVSLKWRNQICRSQANIWDAMFGLIVLSLTGFMFDLYGIYLILSNMLGISFSEASVEFFFTYIVNYLVLIAICLILVWKIRVWHRNDRH